MRKHFNKYITFIVYLFPKLKRFTMKIKNIDHIVITTRDLKRCLEFYVGILGMTDVEHDDRHSLLFGDCKINIHTRKGEFKPAALNPEYGSQDFCLIVDDVEKAEREITEKGYQIEEGIVERHGAKGTMRSLYLRDADGNLVELSQYD